MSARILVVCTGNICRSAYAERRLGCWLADTSIVVESAGTAAVVGEEMYPFSAVELERRGVESGGHVARQVTKEIVSSATLVLTMTREHRTQVVRLAPKALRTAFTVREVAQLLPHVHVGAVSHSPHERLVQLVEGMRLARGRQPGGPEDDVDDPFGLDPEAYEEMAAVLDDALIPMVQAVASAQVG